MKTSVVRCLGVAFALACMVSAVSANAFTGPTTPPSPGGGPASGSDPVYNFSFDAGNGIITGFAVIDVVGNQVESITGSITDTDISNTAVAITGLSLYAGADNTFSYASGWPYVSFGGLSFSTSESDFNIASAPDVINVSLYNLGGGIVASPGTYALNSLPDGGTTLTLLGLAVAGLAGLRRKLSE